MNLGQIPRDRFRTTYKWQTNTSGLRAQLDLQTEYGRDTIHHLGMISNTHLCPSMVIRGCLINGFSTVWIINNYHRSLQWPARNAEPNRSESEQPIDPYACLSSQLVVGQNHPCCSHPKHIARIVLVKMLFTASYTMKKGRHRFLFNITGWCIHSDGEAKLATKCRKNTASFSRS